MSLKNEKGLSRQKETVKKGKKLFYYILPGLIYIFIFCYLPLWGWAYAFVEYKPGRDLFDSTFVGLKNFTFIFGNPVLRKNVFQSIANTLGIQFIGFIFTPLPMIFAIFLNELKSARFKKIAQTVSTLPHFISWVIMFAITSGLLSSTGLINSVLMEGGIIETPLKILTTNKNVWLIQSLLQQWKGLGWNAIVYFSAIAGIDQELYEAAMVDGAGRMKRIWYITVPHLIPTYVVLLIMSIGNLLNTGVDQFLVFGNAMNKEFTETFDLYIYNLGIGSGKISYGVAIGVLKSVIALILFGSANYASKKIRGNGIA